jgi:hypothetical protein
LFFGLSGVMLEALTLGYGQRVWEILGALGSRDVDADLMKNGRAAQSTE